VRAAAYGGVAALTASGVKQILGRRRGAAASRVSIATGGGIRSWAERRVVAGVDCRCGSTRAKPRLRVASMDGRVRFSISEATQYPQKHSLMMELSEISKFTSRTDALARPLYRAINRWQEKCYAEDNR
jgi:hypothetical protein